MRLGKFLLGVAKVSPLLALTQTLTALVSESPLRQALDSVLSEDSADTVIRILNRSVEREALSVLQSIVAQTLQLAHSY